MKVLLVFLGIVCFSFAQAEDVSDKPSGFYGDIETMFGNILYTPHSNLMDEAGYKTHLLFAVESIMGEHCEHESLKKIQETIIDNDKLIQGTIYPEVPKTLKYQSQKQVAFCNSVKDLNPYGIKNKEAIVQAYKNYKCDLFVDPSAGFAPVNDPAQEQALKNCKSMPKSLTMRELYNYNLAKKQAEAHQAQFPQVPVYDQAMGVLPPFVGGAFVGSSGSGQNNLPDNFDASFLRDSDDRTIEDVDWDSDDSDSQSGAGATDNG